MVYCSKCGKKNDEGAEYCSQCGVSLSPVKKDFEKEWENRCEEECSGGKQGSPLWRIFWGLVVLFIGLWIIFEVVLKNLADEIEGLSWVHEFSFPFWWIIGAIFGVIIIIMGIKIILKK
jgi:uncharacterized membrane protein YvbJ